MASFVPVFRCAPQPWLLRRVRCAAAGRVPVTAQIARPLSTCGAVLGARRRVDGMFLPTTEDVPKDASVASHQLMIRAGLITQQAAGLYHLLPLATRAMNKLQALIHREMDRVVRAELVTMPCITPAALWRQTGRWDSMGPELMRLADRHGVEFCLGPTHEEAITHLAAQHLRSHRQLPLRLYQLDRKYRDEVRPRFGLLRAREFWMKDMYTFDQDAEGALATYELVDRAYTAVFRALRLPFVRVEADTGQIGGSLSHEYHLLADVGEDAIVSCPACGFASNRELADRQGGDACPAAAADPAGGGTASCPGTLEEHRGIEVAHAFYLGKKYSEVFGACFTDREGVRRTADMGCYGMGVSRLLAAVVEASHDDAGIVWPAAIAPFSVNVTALNSGKGGASVTSAAEAVYDELESMLPGEVVLDTREHVASASKLAQAQLVGYPYTVVVGKRHDHAALEVRRRADGVTLSLSPSELAAAARVL